MREKLWLFIGKFILISVPLFALWHWKGQDSYLILFNHLLTFLLIKLAGLGIQYFPAPTDIFNNLIPFVSLMIITRGIELKTRLSRAAWGLLILIGWHMVLTMAVYLLHEGYGITGRAYEKLSVPLYLFSETLPFVLWILFARRQMAGLFLRRKKTAR
ncbi:MAG: hypothetical protein GTO24_21485 [candidate division Zixibacteria bacterium]|nr:hypothetical protein [candidate division Zixibacteria bacterium]